MTDAAAVHQTADQTALPKKCAQQGECARLVGGLGGSHVSREARAGVDVTLALFTVWHKSTGLPHFNRGGATQSEESWQNGIRSDSGGGSIP